MKPDVETVVPSTPKELLTLLGGFLTMISVASGRFLTLIQSLIVRSDRLTSRRYPVIWNAASHINLG